MLIWLPRSAPGSTGGTRRPIKGLRLVTAYGLAAMLATMPEIAQGHATSTLILLASGFAL